MTWRDRDLHLTRWIFLRAVAAVFLIAFVSLWVQIDGLVGSRGIRPAAAFLAAAREHLGTEAYWRLPTLFWLGSGDAALHLACAAGVLGSLLALLNLAPAVALFSAWALYLSLLKVGGEFLSFQWDVLLLETGFLAVLFAPWRLRPGLCREAPPPWPAVWLLRLLAFRLLFSSGVVKLLWGDPTWLDGSALDHHYETQPLPTWIGWYAHQLPRWFQRASVWVMYAIEVVLPFGIFLGRRARQVCFAGQAFLQVLILLTGNYNFFNLLTIALCFMALDDACVRRALRLPAPSTEPPARPPAPLLRVQRGVVLAWAIPITYFGILELEELAGRALKVCVPALAYERPAFLAKPGELAAPFHLVSGYGLFRVMTTERREIVVEGSRDGKEWLAYEFKWKPGDVRRRPAFVEPHQPRLDWQMWFAALGTFRQNPWFHGFLLQLFEGSPPVLELLDTNPFPGEPPRYLRALLYDYEMTTIAERRASGAWWKRRLLGQYTPVLSLPSKR